MFRCFLDDLCVIQLRNLILVMLLHDISTRVAAQLVTVLRNKAVVAKLDA